MSDIPPENGSSEEGEVPPILSMGPFRFDDQTMLELLDLLGHQEGDAEKLVRPPLEEIANDYLRWKEQQEETPSRAERNAAIRDLGRYGENAAELARHIRLLDHDALFEIIHHFEFVPDPDQERPSLSRRHTLVQELEAFQKAAEAAQRSIDKSRGPERDSAVSPAIEQLVVIYEEVTEKEVTHNPSTGSVYDGAPLSQAGQFIRRFFEAVDKSVPFTAISSTLAALIRIRNGRKKDS